MSKITELAAAVEEEIEMNRHRIELLEDELRDEKQKNAEFARRLHELLESIYN